MSDEEIDRIARRVVELQGRNGATAEILTRKEAAEFVKRPSKSAFFKWCKKHHVAPSSRGRYSRTRLNLGLQREARRIAA